MLRENILEATTPIDFVSRTIQIYAGFTLL